MTVHETNLLQSSVEGTTDLLPSLQSDGKDCTFRDWDHRRLMPATEQDWACLHTRDLVRLTLQVVPTASSRAIESHAWSRSSR